MSSSSPLALIQLQSVGDIIGKAIRICRSNAGLFLSALLMPTIFMAVSKVMIQWGASQLGKSGHLVFAGLLSNLALIVVGSIILIISLWVFTIRQLAIVRLINGVSTDYSDALKKMNAITGKLFLFFFLYMLVFVGILVVFTIGIVVLLMLSKAVPIFMPLAAIALLLTAFLAICLSCVIAASSYLITICFTCEDATFMDTITHGVSLTLHNWSRALGFMVLLFLTATVLSYPLSLPLVIIATVEVFRHVSASGGVHAPEQMPLYYMVIAQAWESLMHMIIWPVIFVAYGLLYEDFRVRQEGIDLLGLIEAQT